MLESLGETLGSLIQLQAIALAFSTFITALCFTFRAPYIHNFRLTGMQGFTYKRLADIEQQIEKASMYREFAKMYFDTYENYRRISAFFTCRAIEGLISIFSFLFAIFLPYIDKNMAYFSFSLIIFD